MKKYIVHTICTCYVGRLCGSSHSSWEDFENKKCKANNCGTCIGTNQTNERLLSMGFDFRPGRNSMYEKIKND